MSVIEHELKQVQQKDEAFTKNMTNLTHKMEAFIEELKDLAVKIQLQNNRVLMMNNPILHDKIEEVRLKYQHLNLSQ